MINRTIARTATAAAVALAFTNVSAEIIAFDLVDSGSLNLTEYNNSYTDAFSSAGDGFQIYQQGVSPTIPFALVDDSAGVFPNDNIGIVDTSNTDTFFGMVDTVNSDNNEPVSAEWVFDVTGATNLSLSLDMAAMGDFESSDVFSWSYSLDGGALTTLFNGITDNDISQDYTLENGMSFNLNDPMTVNGVSLSNEFLNFSNMINGTGSSLSIYLIGSANGGSEAIAFQNLIINGETAMSVSEPSILVLFGLGLGLVGFARRK